MEIGQKEHLGEIGFENLIDIFVKKKSKIFTNFLEFLRNTTMKILILFIPLISYVFYFRTKELKKAVKSGDRSRVKIESAVIFTLILLTFGLALFIILAFNN